MRDKGSLPSDIPSKPENRYADEGWDGYGDWLGTGNVASFLKKYQTFDQARVFARKLGLKSRKDWNEFCRGNLTSAETLPIDIPAAPQSAYINKGWSGWGDWLGTGTLAPKFRQYRRFNDARNFSRGLGLRSAVEWSAFCKGEMPHFGLLPADIPAAVSQIYAGKGWAGWSDWLGTGRTRDSKSPRRKS